MGTFEQLHVQFYLLDFVALVVTAPSNVVFP